MLYVISPAKSLDYDTPTPPAVQALASDVVSVTGTVPDVRPYLQHAAAVVAQATGKVRVPPAHVAHFAEWAALPRPPRFRLRHIKRTQNLAGIALTRSREKIGKE